MASSSIKQRPNGMWRARHRDSLGREHARHFSTRKAAQDWLDGVTAAKVSGTWTDPKASRVTVAVWSAQWLGSQAHLKPSTHARYASLVRNHIVPTWGKAQLGDISHADIQSWVTRMSAKLSATSVRHAHRVLSLMLDLAVRDNRIPRNPAAGVRLPRASKSEKRFLTHEQVARFAQATDDVGHALVILMLAYTGLRWGELAALRVSRLDLMRRRILVAEAVTEVDGILTWGTPKSHQQREVPIPRFLVDRLAAQVAAKDPDALVFTTDRGAPLRNQNFRRDVFDPAARAAGLDGITPHELRHTAAALAVSVGGNVKSVQRMLGHASAAMTLDVYAGLFDDDLDGLADRLDEAVSGRLADSVRTGGSLSQIHSQAAGL